MNTHMQRISVQHMPQQHWTMSVQQMYKRVLYITESTDREKEIFLKDRDEWFHAYVVVKPFITKSRLRDLTAGIYHQTELFVPHITFFFVPKIMYFHCYLKHKHHSLLNNVTTL